MIRRATRADIPRLSWIRDNVGENRLSDPAAVTPEDYLWFVDNGPVWAWQGEDGAVNGFAAADARNGWIWALFVSPGHEGRGIGRALLRSACDSLRGAGYRVAKLSTDPGTRAEQHYRKAGWVVTGKNGKGELIFEKKL